MDTIGIMARTRRRLGRIGRILKWTGVVLCVLLTVSIVLSRWGSAGIALSDNHACAIRNGAVVVQKPLYGALWIAYERTRKPGKLNWWFLSHQSPSTFFVTPLWIPLALIAVPTIWLWRRDRRFPDGHCLRCGYNLTGNVSGKCSECGNIVEPT